MTGRESNLTPEPLNEEALLALIEGEMDAARETALMAGLDAATLSRVQKMRRQCVALRSVAEAAPPVDLLDRVGAALEREALVGGAVDADGAEQPFQINEYREAPASSGRWQRRVALAAALALMAGGAAYWGLRFAPTEQPKMADAGSMANAIEKATGPSAIASSHIEPDPDRAFQKDEPAPDQMLAKSDFAPDPIDVAATDASADAVLAMNDGSESDSDLNDPAAYGWSDGSQPLGVFNEVPQSLDLDDAARLAEQGLLVIRIRADRPGIAAAKLLAQADSRAGKGRIWRLMPCPPPDLSDAIEAALPAERGDESGVPVPYRAALRPTIEAAFSLELEPSAVSIAIVQAELEAASEGAVILDVLDRPVTMPPPCAEGGGLRGWTSAPTSLAHSVVVPVVVESEP